MAMNGILTYKAVSMSKEIVNKTQIKQKSTTILLLNIRRISIIKS